MCQLANKTIHSISILCVSWQTRPYTPSVFCVSAGEQDNTLHQYSVCQLENKNTPSVFCVSWRTRTLHRYSMCQLEKKTTHSISIFCVSKRTRTNTPSLLHVSVRKQNKTLHQYSLCQFENKTTHSISNICIHCRIGPTLHQLCAD